MLKGKYIFGDEDISEALHVRRKVFKEEQHLNENNENKDDIDEKSIIVVGYYNEKPIATGRLYFDGVDYKISKIAVLHEYRGNNYGDFIVRMLIDKAFIFGAKSIHVISQGNAKSFYEKIGFKVIGETYIEDGVERIPMVLNMNELTKNCNANR